MSKLHRIGLVFSVSAVALVFLGFWIAGTAGEIEFSSSYFWTFVILPLAVAAGLTGLSWKWPIVGGCTGVVSPFAFCFTLDMDTFGRWLYTAAIILYFTGGILLLIAAIKAKK
jgi:hypothetical protein